MIEPLNRLTQIVDTETGRPTQAFLDWITSIRGISLSDLQDVRISSPTDGQQLTYSAAEKRWIPV